jgi:hypothetical protein
MTEFDTYQGASTIIRKTLDWKRSKIAMFELDVVPQSWMLYVQNERNSMLGEEWVRLPLWYNAV